MSSGHSIVAPSAAARRWQCSASTTMEARVPEPEDSQDQLDGEAAHWGLAETLKGETVGLGQIAENGVPLNEEMLEGIDLMHHDILRELAPFGLVPSQGQIEKPMALPAIHAQAWGTPDFRIWLPGWHLLMYDFKFGRRYVPVYENPQLIEYLSGELTWAHSKGVLDTQIRVTLKIVQPRSYSNEGPVRSWTFIASDVRALINRGFNAAHEALGPNPRMRVGPECRDCRARHQCPALQAAAMHACDIAVQSQPMDLPVQAMALEYRTLKRYETLIAARASGLEEQLLALARTGKPTPGVRIEHGTGRVRWGIPDAQVIAIGQALGVDLKKPTEAVTPKQALDKGLHPATLEGITKAGRGEARLVEDDGSLARKVFG